MAISDRNRFSVDDRPIGGGASWRGTVAPLLAVAGSLFLLAGCTEDEPAASATCPVVEAEAAPDFVSTRVTGPVPTAISESGNLAAVLWGPTDAGAEAKITWIKKEVEEGPPASSTLIEFTSSEQTILDRPPGPSTVTFPTSPGCYPVTVTWGDNKETINIPVA